MMTGTLISKLKRFHDMLIQKFNNIPIAGKDIDKELEKLKSPSAT
jgi:hypothetical protein